MFIRKPLRVVVLGPLLAAALGCSEESSNGNNAPAANPQGGASAVGGGSGTGSESGGSGAGGAGGVAVVPIPGAIYVSPGGSDETGDGSFGRPFASPGRALEAAQGALGEATKDVVVALRGGTYELAEPLQFGGAISGTEAARLVLQSQPGESAILSGGSRISGFVAVPGSSLFKAHVPMAHVRQFYANGAWRPRASSDGWLDVGRWEGGPVVAAAAFGPIAQPSTMEVYLQTNWRSYLVGVESVTRAGAEQKLTLASEPLSNLQMAPDYVYPSTARKVRVENALELVDQPGEWFFDASEQDLYYLPLPGEVPALTEYVVPRLGKIVEFSGASAVTLSQLTMAYAAWNRPGEVRAMGCWQADDVAYPHDTGAPIDGVAPAAVGIDASTDIVLEGCTVHGTGAVGVGVYRNVTEVRVSGGRIYDTGSAAITVGSGQRTGSGHIVIENTVVRRAGRTNYGAPGIQVFYADAISILHCDLADLPYSGIALGWGWNTTAGQTWNGSNHRISNNRVANYMNVTFDGGGVYTLGNNPNTLISGNYFKDMRAACGCLYNDEGSQGFTWENNVCENAPSWLHWWTDTIRNNVVRSTYSTTATARLDAPDNQREDAVVVPDANWPPAARAIIDAAGVEPAFASLVSPAP